MRNNRQINRQRKRGSRLNAGSQMAELGPGLLLLLTSAFFPLILLSNLAVTYGAGYTLNNLQLREATVSKAYEAQNPSGNVIKNIPSTWRNSGIGKYCSLTGDPATTVSYKDGLNANGVQDNIVVITTTMQTQPMLSGMPFAAGIPGLTSPSTFVFQSEAVMENPDDVIAQAPSSPSPGGGPGSPAPMPTPPPQPQPQPQPGPAQSASSAAPVYGPNPWMGGAYGWYYPAN